MERCEGEVPEDPGNLIAVILSSQLVHGVVEAFTERTLKVSVLDDLYRCINITTDKVALGNRPDGIKLLARFLPLGRSFPGRLIISILALVSVITTKYDATGHKEPGEDDSTGNDVG
jgi:hypothetical protein